MASRTIESVDNSSKMGAQNEIPLSTFLQSLTFDDGLLRLARTIGLSTEPLSAKTLAERTAELRSSVLQRRHKEDDRLGDFEVGMIILTYYCYIYGTDAVEALFEDGTLIRKKNKL